MNEQIARVLGLVQPDVVHVHNLLNLSFDLPRAAHAAGAAVVATLHDYTLVCASGGQRLHRAERHICDVIETESVRPLLSRVAVLRADGLQPRAAWIAGSSCRATSGDGATRPVAAPCRPRRIGRWSGRQRAGYGLRSGSPARGRAPLFEEIDLFVAPSRFLAAEFERLGVKAAQMRVWELGFAALGGDCTSATARVPAAATPGQPLRFGYVGTLCGTKAFTS